MAIYVEESSGRPMPEIEKIISKKKYNTKSIEDSPIIKSCSAENRAEKLNPVEFVHRLK
jgi:hypothetical protein